MIVFFQVNPEQVYAVSATSSFSEIEINQLSWLFGEARPLDSNILEGPFVGPRKEMITPWSTNAVEITQNMGIKGILRIEAYRKKGKDTEFDPMLQSVYKELNTELFDIHVTPKAVREIQDIGAYSEKEGLALSQEEVVYLEEVSKKLGRPLTDSEVFGFSQVNSEHCRHKIFNGTFIIDGKKKEATLFQLIKKTSQANPNRIVSAYKDNVAFVKGPMAQQFSPQRQDIPDFFRYEDIPTVLSLKAETHNFPTTVEPFNGAATGSGGEIRDRLAGGTASIPLAGTAVYMTSYPRSEKGRTWEKNLPERGWLYQTPMDILIKASNGASDFGNKFGQPLICGSVLTFEHEEEGKSHAYDKVIMLAGGIGFTRAPYAQKKIPKKGDSIVVMGGDNYRIGMGGGAVSSVNTGEFSNLIELNAIQRSNPEMQKRVANVIRAMAEHPDNPIISIHDHGAGGHLNCLSELVEETGGHIAVEKLPVGDPTLSAKEIIGNESQERMGLVIDKANLSTLKSIAERERAPFYEVGKTTGDMRFTFENCNTGEKPMDWELAHMFGSSPKTILEDTLQSHQFPTLSYDPSLWQEYLSEVLQIEAVACKDWLTNKVDRSVTGRVATQQTTGAIQLPLNNVAVMALDYTGKKGIATSIGHAPVAALVDSAAGSRLAIAEALTNLVWTPIAEGLQGVSLSANWMWPAKNPGENSRLYQAVEACSEFALALGINIPTGKDSLSMTQKYPNGKTVYSPGTVIISTIGECEDIRKTVTTDLKSEKETQLLYLDFSGQPLALGGSSFAQILNQVGEKTPDLTNPEYFAKAFQVVQELVKEELVLAGHDISAGGLITALLEMCFPNPQISLNLTHNPNSDDPIPYLFAENPGVLLQVRVTEPIEELLKKSRIKYQILGEILVQPNSAQHNGKISWPWLKTDLDITSYRKKWFTSSYLLDRKQSGVELAKTRFEQFENQTLKFDFGRDWKGTFESLGIRKENREKAKVNAAIIREKGVNGDREMAYALYMAGFEVKDVHMTDLITGRESLEDVQMIVFVGGFSNSDVLGSAKGWAGAFLYNEKAKKALDNFYARPDTLSLGVCNGCQLMVELGLIYPEHEKQPKMQHNESQKFESNFVNVDIPPTNSVMLGSLAGKRLGVWVAHGEGKFELPLGKEDYQLAMTYSYSQYPGNPNGSRFNAAGISSADGRHLAMMPHIERSLFPWNWPHYPAEWKKEDISPWVEAFVNARKWAEAQ
ncbi:phosphoribosylformylglycinamidine synthase [Pleomorphovibrio marinus]|uniref:phosphoribosylformylglycinamidine synthase n=1 Tax=Pleomorphovibrio marinus TaxID=2164132 RepID=UPI000E0AC7CB|nr:phosphoribosylformylglycinamidine synthase [Pleomorphovibrio marinus]